MKKSRSIEAFCSKNPRKWWKPSRFFLLLLFAVAALYLFFCIAALSHFRDGDGDGNGGDSPFFDSAYRPRSLNPDPKPVKDLLAVRGRISYGRITGEIMRRRGQRFSWSGNLTKLETMAHNAWNLGSKAWEELENYEEVYESSGGGEKKIEPCPSSVSLHREKKTGKFGTEEMMLLPCGLEVGSSITVIGMPLVAHKEFVPELIQRGRGGGGGNGMVMVSQFMVELQGIKAVESEDPPKVLHFNPRLKGDWSGRPVIELNTCYRMQWGQSMRCDGMPSAGDDEDKGLIFALHLCIL